MDLDRHVVPGVLRHVGQRLTLERGDAAGRNLRPVGSVDIPLSIPNGPTHALFPLSVPVTVFTPRGVVVLAFYRSDNGTPGRVLGAVIQG